MNVQELQKVLEKNKVPEWYYTIHALGGGDCYGISNDDDGWFIFFSERGQQRNKKYFISELLACEALIDKVNDLLDKKIIL